MLFHDVNADDGVTGRRRIDGEHFALEIFIVSDSRRHHEFLIDALAAAQKDDEIIFLRVFALAFRPGNDVIRVIENEIVFAADQIAQKRRRVGDRIDLDAQILLL